jgi:4-amino-4-deoxy-L-arabinose transferase-like glycosyltransferase
MDISIKRVTFMIYTSLLYFLIYQIVNFLYFPLDFTFPDEHRFFNEAVEFSQTGKFLNGVSAWEMPATAIFYGFLYTIVESKETLIVLVRVIQSLLMIFGGWMVFNISLLIFKKESVAFISFFIYLSYPFFIFYQGMLLSETLFIYFLLTSFYFLYKWKEEGFLFDRYFYLTNIFFILCIYTKATLIFLPPILVTILFFAISKKTKCAIKIFILSSLVFILLMSPWWIRNYQIFNEFIPFTTSSGANLYLGNNPNNKLGGVDWGVDVERDIVDEISLIKGESDRNKAYTKRALSYIENNPLVFVEHVWLKFKRFWNITPNAKSYNSGAHKWITIISFTPILFFSIISLYFNRSFFNKLTPIYVLIVFFTILHVVVISSLRYRLPLEPFLIIISSPVFFSFWKLINNVRHSWIFK